MELKLKEGLNGVKTGIRVAAIGKKVLEQKKKLPKEKKKALQRAAKRAAAQAAKQEEKQLRKEKGRKAIKKTKGIGRVALAIWNRYY